MSDDTRLATLGQFTPEGRLTQGYGDHYLFFVGRDDCHDILMLLLAQETLGVKGNSYGYDDDDVNTAIMGMFKKPNMLVQWTLDKSQAGGVHERKIVELDMQLDGADFQNSFAIGQSATHDISHTKATAFLGQGIFVEGSMNLSASGEGTGISLKADVKNPKGFHAQNNTLLVSTNPVAMARLCARLDAEHQIARAQQRAASAK